MDNKKPSETTKQAVKALITVSVIKGMKEIETAITSIAKRGKTLEHDIHVAAVSIIAHTEQHGDITLANKLIEAIPNLARKNALRDWFQAFGKFNYSTETKQMTYDKRKTTKQDTATETPFWAFKPEAPYQPFNLEVAIATLIDKAEKRAEAGDKRDVIPAHKLGQLRLLSGKADKPAAKAA